MAVQRAVTRSLQRLTTSRSPLRALRRTYASGSSSWKPADNAFNRERAAVRAHAAESTDFWRKASIYVVIPCLVIFSANAYTLWNEHWEHEAHAPPASEKPQFPYLNVRSKPYPWGDGNKTLFWNPKVNYVKDE